MRISFRLEGAANLRSLPAIEVHRVALIAGFNGIGKTTSLRLLDLCLGKQPWLQHPSAWRTLRGALRSARVTVEDLAGGAKIVWNLDPGKWPPIDDEVPPTPGVPPIPDDSWFAIEVNGKPAALAEVQGLLSLERISGDSTLLQTIAHDIEALGHEFGRLSGLARGSAATGAAELLANAVARLRAADGAELAARRRARDHAVSAARQAHGVVAELMSEVSDLDQAIDLAHRAGQLVAALPTLDAQIADVTARLDAANEEFERLRDELRAAEVAAAVAKDRNNEVQNARRLAERHRAALRRATSQLVEVLTSIGIEPEADDVREQVRARLKATTSELEETRRRRHEIDATPLLDAAIQDLLASLSRARARGIGQEVVILALGEDEGLTIDDLFEQLTRRRSLLTSQSDASTGELDGMIRRLEAARAQLRRATSLLQEQQRLPPLIERAERRVATALEGAPDSVRLRELSTGAATAERTVAVLAGERAALAGRRLALADGASPEALQDQLEVILERLGVNSVDDLQSARLERIRQLSAARAEDDAAAQEAARAADNFEAAQLQHDLARAAISEDSFLARVRASIPPGIGLAEAAEALDEIDALLQDLPSRLDGIQGVLRSGADHVHGRAQWPETELARRVRSWLDVRLGQWFRDPSVRAALFPRADRVDVNLERRQVQWFEGPARQELPFEAFSSGQQAFAYTKARLEELGESTTPNRLVALDEFGSFLASDLRDDLRSLLVERQAQHPHDSVLLILPVTEDPEQQARTTAGRDRERYLARASELGDRGYYMEELH